MNFEKWSAAERAAVAAINAFGKLGIHAQAGDPTSTVALLQTVRARAFDAHLTTAPRGEADLHPVDRVEDADELDDDDLRLVLGDIEKMLQSNRLDGGNRRFLQRLSEQIQQYLTRNQDSNRMRGRAMRDQMDAASRVTGKASNIDPWDNYASGATDTGRKHLARSRRLAARAKDAKPAPGRSFLGRRPEPGSDLDVLDRMAARTFNL